MESLRTTGPVVTTQVMTRVTTLCNGTSSTLQTPWTRNKYYKSTLGYNTPNFHKRLKAGELLPMTTFDQFEYSLDGFACDYSYVRKASCTGTNTKSSTWTNTSDHLTFFSWTPTVHPYEVPESYIPDVNYCLQSAAAQIASAGYDALTTLAELNKTIAMVANLFVKVINLTRGVSPGKWQDLWLEARYGWRTLIYDLEGLQEVLLSFDEARTRYRKNSGLQNQYIADLSKTTVFTGNYDRVETGAAQYDISVRGNVIADIQPPKFSFNPITTAWELVPFSFVVDWLFNIGTALASLSFLAMSSKSVAAAGYYITLDRNYSFNLVSTSSTLTWAGSGFVEESASWTHRHPASIPLLPITKLRLDVSKIIDLLAIALQQLRRN